VKERNCFIVVKNGKIVKETYRMERKPESIREMWSATKALCSSLFGVAVERGWANVDQQINASEWNTRQCNPEAGD
jgi:CubicO group peptidase (beta-lactamase class C family)